MVSAENHPTKQPGTFSKVATEHPLSMELSFASTMVPCLFTNPENGKFLPIFTAAMAALRLSYLPFQAMAETTRFLFRYGGVKYQDEVNEVSGWGWLQVDSHGNMQQSFDHLKEGNS